MYLINSILTNMFNLVKQQRTQIWETNVNLLIVETLLNIGQGSYRQVGVKFMDFSRTSKCLSNSFQGLNVNENTDLSVKSLLHKC